VNKQDSGNRSGWGAQVWLTGSLFHILRGFSPLTVKFHVQEWAARAERVDSLKEEAGPRETMHQITTQQIAMHQEVNA
jgi:hypothetical protein